jgi:hypothetical protein
MTKSSKLVIALGCAIAVLGIAILVSIERALNRSLYLLDAVIITAPRFVVFLASLVGVAIFLVIFGISSALTTDESRRKRFIIAEAPAALLGAGVWLYILNVFRVVGDVGPRNPIDSSTPIAWPVLVFIRPALFYPLLAGASLVLATTVWRRLRSAG